MRVVQQIPIKIYLRLPKPMGSFSIEYLGENENAYFCMSEALKNGPCPYGWAIFFLERP